MGSVRIKQGLLFVVLPILLISLLSACDQFNHDKVQQASFLTQVFGTNPTGDFKRAYRPHKFSFPRDYAVHPEFRHEWWYFTGNLNATSGQRFGYELTILRVALSGQVEEAVLQDTPSQKKQRNGTVEPELPSSKSALLPGQASGWRSDHFYIAHFALTDIENKTFYYSERLSRDAMGLAGAGVYFKEQVDQDSINLRVWLADWGVESVGDGIFPVRVYAKDKDVSINLVLRNKKPVVKQGDEGLWTKGQTPGNAAYYFSITRMETAGTVEINSQQYAVTGDSWFDREWSTTETQSGLPGRDWFRLQLSDDREIMFHASRDNALDNVIPKNGNLNEYSIGSIVDANGDSRTLTYDEVEITVVRHWNSPHSNIKYPSTWKITIPSESLVLQVTPLVEDQELNLSVRFWEGAVKVSGKQNSDGSIITGYGYVELSGYTPG